MASPAFAPSLPLRHRSATFLPTSTTRATLALPVPVVTRATSLSRSAVTPLRTAQALSLSLSTLSLSPTPRVAVVNFVSPACRACAYASRAYERLAAGAHGDFFSVDVSEVGDACKDMGVESVPSWRVFVGEVGGVWEVDEVVGPRSVKRVGEIVQDIVDGGFDRNDWEEDDE